MVQGTHRPRSRSTERSAGSGSRRGSPSPISLGQSQRGRRFHPATLTAWPLAVLASACLLLGCQTRPGSYLDSLPPVPLADKPSQLQLGYGKLNAEGGRNYVVNQLEIGYDAFQLGLRRYSESALDAALDAIEAVFGEDANAAKARRIWCEEGMKTFKGEPYERAMAYYYRGLLYIQAGDLENARACFRGGMFQDAFAEEEQHRSDFASLLYLEAWCSLMLGDRSAADDAVRFLRKLRPDSPHPRPGANLLIIGETGTAPRKLARGPGQSELTFARGRGLEKRVRVALDAGGRSQLYPAEDVYWQASTRGGRPVEHILQRKVVFRKRWDAAGTALTQAGMTGVALSTQLPEGRGRDRAVVASAAAVGVGALAQIVAFHVKPRADTRRCRNLPDAVHVAAVPSPPGEHTVRFEFLDAAGRRLHSQTKTVAIPAGGAGPALVWARSPRILAAGR